MASGVTELIDQLYATISDAKSFPLTVDKCMLDRTNALDLLDEIKEQLPAEVTEAKRLISAKGELIRKTREEADQIIRDANAEAARLVDKENIVMAAKARSEEIMKETKQKCDELRRSASLYADDVLRHSEEGLRAALEGLQHSRSSFRSASGYKD